MFNICRRCGQYRADKEIDPSGPYAICPECGEQHPFRQLPLLLICGPSGGGKTAVLRALLGKVTAAVLLEGDLLWRPEFNQPEDSYRDFYETWLRLAKNINQSGRPVALFNAGRSRPTWSHASNGAISARPITWRWCVTTMFCKRGCAHGRPGAPAAIPPLLRRRCSSTIG